MIWPSFFSISPYMLILPGDMQVIHSLSVFQWIAIILLLHLFCTYCCSLYRNSLRGSVFCPFEILLVILHALIHCLISDLLPISFLHLSSPNDTVLIFSIHRIYSSFNLSFFFPLLILAILQFSDF